MFDDLVVSSANPKRTNNPWTVALSAIIQLDCVRDDFDPAHLYGSAAQTDAYHFPCCAAAASAAAAACCCGTESREAVVRA